MNDYVLQHLRVISIEKLHAAGGIPGIETLTPDDLKRDRGINIGELFEGKIFVDRDLGYAIVHETIAKKFIKILNTQIKIMSGDPVNFGNFIPLDDSDIHDNWTAKIKSNVDNSKLLDEVARNTLPWYVNPAERWPKQKGKGVRVAVFDNGIRNDVPRLKRNEQHKDFCSCFAPGQPTGAIDVHGTKSAGAIGAANDSGIRTSPAPECTLVVAQVTRDDGISVHLVDLLLMLSWAVRTWDVRVGCLSFSLDRTELEHELQKDVLSQVAVRLRERNQMLLFAAIDDTGGRLSYPACLDGFVAVGTFFRPTTESETTYHPSAMVKKEMLFGPKAGVLTVTHRGAESYEDPSAACAYVTGVAALYVERYYKEKGVKGVLGELLALPQEALKVQEAPWPGVRLNPQHPKS